MCSKKKDKKEKKAGKRMKKKELGQNIADFFHERPGEVFSLRFIFDQLRLNTHHPQNAVCGPALRAEGR